MSSTTAVKPTFTAPEVAQNTNYTIKLVVNDGTANSSESTVVVTVNHVNKVPVANAGSAQTVNEGSLVTLDGSGSNDGDSQPLTYVWTAPAGITLSSASSAKPTFTAPEVDGSTSYEFKLVVNDGNANSSESNVFVLVDNVNKVPVANAGSAQTVNEGSVVTLDASGSTDGDSDALTYSWIVPGSITLSSTSAVKPTFTAPEVDQNTNFTIKLVVNDGTANSSESTVVVGVNHVNKVPVANAGSAQTVNEGSLVTLDASGSSDPDPDILTYIWTAPAGITLSSASSAKPTFTAPEVDGSTSYEFKLVVNDGNANSSESNVFVLVNNVIKPSGDIIITGVTNKTSSAPMSFNFKTSIGVKYEIGASDDLKKWSTIQTINGTGQEARFTDNRKTKFEKQYYRIKVSN